MKNRQTVFIKTIVILLLLLTGIMYYTKYGFFKSQAGHDKIRLAIEYLLHGSNGPLDQSRHDGELTSLRLEDTADDLTDSQRELKEEQTKNSSLQDENHLLRLEGQSSTNRIYQLEQENSDLEYELLTERSQRQSAEADRDNALSLVEKLPLIVGNLESAEANLEAAKKSLIEERGKLDVARENLKAERKTASDEREKFGIEREKSSAALKEAERKFRAAEIRVKAFEKIEKQLQDRKKAKNDPPHDFLDPKN